MTEDDKKKLQDDDRAATLAMLRYSVELNQARDKVRDLEWSMRDAERRWAKVRIAFLESETA